MQHVMGGITFALESCTTRAFNPSGLVGNRTAAAPSSSSGGSSVYVVLSRSQNRGLTRSRDLTTASSSASVRPSASASRVAATGFASPSVASASLSPVSPSAASSAASHCHPMLAIALLVVSGVTLAL